MYVDRRWFVEGWWEEVDTDLRFFEFLKNERRGVCCGDSSIDSAWDLLIDP